MLSNGSIFITTAVKAGKLAAATVKAITPPPKSQRFLVCAPKNGRIKRWNKRSIFAVRSAPEPTSCGSELNSFTANQGVSTKATTKEINMPAEAFIGIGLI